jgi:hypothetical protein
MSKKLCSLVKKDGLKEDLKGFKKLVREPKFLCKKCGRAAEKEKHLCKAVELDA